MEQNEKIQQLRKKAVRLPAAPGVYLMKDKSGTVIYVGKAKALKSRVPQYFGSPNGHELKVRRMVENVDDFDYILTDSEFEALVLECSLIKQHRPKYNILLKDDKGYSYIKVTRGAWRKISAEKQAGCPDCDYIGPYASSFAVTQSVDEALKVFRLPQCSKRFPRDIGRGRACLNYYISQCSAPCAGKISESDYAEAVAQALDFLKNGSAELLRALESQMDAASEALDFERAARLRDRIFAIKKLSEKQKVVSASVKEQDVFAIAEGADRACLNVLRFSEGRLFDSEYFLIDRPDSLPSARRELILGYYGMRDSVPPSVVLDGELEDEELVREWLSVKRGRRVEIVLPQRGVRAETLEMCRKNASERLAQSVGRVGKDVAALDELSRLLALQAPPEYIEAYDISHTAGSGNVAGMVVFRDGKPLRSAYRRFEIKGFIGQDDCASMAEVVGRRLKRLEDEGESGEGFGRRPDLILLDGGAAQVRAVKPVVEAFGLDIPVFGMVKDGHHRTRAIAADGGEISMTAKRQAFTLVSTIQEEVHRFAVEYHRKKRGKASLSSTLLRIPGIGEKRARELLAHFKTIKAIAEADVEELSRVDGVSAVLAQTIFDCFHP